MSTQPIPIFTAEQYLELERKSEFRSEFIKGGIYAMSGGTRNHALVMMNAAAALHQQLKGKPCSVVSSDMRIHSRTFGIYTYPDVVVTCGPDQFLDERKDVLTDATLIVEVLSPSTQSYDRGEKFLYYRSLPSFQEYLILWQTEIRAEHHVKQPDGSWLFREHMQPETEINLSSIGCQVILADLYDRVVLESA